MVLRTETGKECTVCHKVKLWSEFSIARAKMDGHKYRCKQCDQEIKAKEYRANIQVVRARERERYEKNRIRYAQAKKEQFKITGKHSTQDPYKQKARSIFRYAVRKGAIVRGVCEVGVDCRGRVEGHHEDYSKPLEVRWLCTRHHLHLHRLLREESEKHISTLTSSE